MKQQFTARVSQDENSFVAQCLEVDVASQGDTQEQAILNLREALELHFAEPRATVLPGVQRIEVEVGGD